MGAKYDFQNPWCVANLFNLHVFLKENIQNTHYLLSDFTFSSTLFLNIANNVSSTRYLKIQSSKDIKILVKTDKNP